MTYILKMDYNLFSVFQMSCHKFLKGHETDMEGRRADKHGRLMNTHLR